MWDGIDQPLPDHNWPLIAASAQQYLPGVSDWSRAMTRADMDRVLHDFVACTRRAAAAGFDWLELHCAHGYLLSSFISPLTNKREDAYGGAIADVDCAVGDTPCLTAAHDHGFVIDEAEVVYWGLCPDCSTPSDSGRNSRV